MKKTLLLAFLLTALVQITAQSTYVPDDNFEQALIDLGYDDVLDDYVVTVNIIGVTHLVVSGKNISDLTGIEDFTSLIYLSCWDNNLTALDVSQNVALIKLFCSNNQISILDVSQNTELIILACGHNQLSTLDVSQNIQLRSLTCHINELSTLDLSQNIQLTYLGCYENQLSTLDVSQNIQLTDMNCTSNQLSALDVSQNIQLTALYCEGNQLSTLDVSQNTQLSSLFCSNNDLENLDVTQNIQLISLYCRYNELENLDVRNGNNTAIYNYNSLNNSALKCIFVDDANWSEANWTDIDPASTFVETQVQCNNLGIDEVILQGFEIYPNPVIEKLFINNSNNLNIQSIQLYDVLGKQVILELYNFQQIDVSSLKSGVYIVNIETDRGIFNKNLIKE